MLNLMIITKMARAMVLAAMTAILWCQGSRVTSHTTNNANKMNQESPEWAKNIARGLIPLFESDMRSDEVIFSSSETKFFQNMVFILPQQIGFNHFELEGFVYIHAYFGVRQAHCLARDAQAVTYPVCDLVDG